MLSKIRSQCTGYLLFVVFVAAFSGFLYGYFTAIISGALSFLTRSFHLSLLDQGVVVSILLFGALLGALIAGALADQLGRKWTLSITSLLLIGGAVVTALCNSYEVLLFGRFIGGVGVGIISVAGPLYLAEISPSSYRGSFVSLFQLLLTIGILFSFGVNYLFSESGDWRWMFGLGAIPALLQMIALFFVPETPPWHLYRGLKPEATRTLRKLHKGGDWRKLVAETQPASLEQKKQGWRALFSPKLRWILIVGFLLSAFQQITGINTVFYYTPKIFAEAGFHSTQSGILAAVSLGAINVLVTIFSVWLLSKLGRRVMLLIGAGGMSLSLLAVAIAFFFQASAIAFISLVAFLAYTVFFALGLGPVTWVILSEIYPMKVRALAMTIAIFINWGCNYLVSLTFPDLFASLGAKGAFLLYACVCAASFWFIYRFIPETRGKSLEEIEKLVTK